MLNFSHLLAKKSVLLIIIQNILNIMVVKKGQSAGNVLIESVIGRIMKLCKLKAFLGKQKLFIRKML